MPESEIMFKVLKSVDHDRKCVSFSLRGVNSGWGWVEKDGVYTDPKYPNSSKKFTLDCWAFDEAEGKKVVAVLEAAYKLAGYTRTSVKPV